MEEEKGKVELTSNEPEVVFKALSDRFKYQIKTEDDQFVVMEISGYDLSIKWNRDLLNDIADVESLLDGLKDMFRKLIMQDLLENHKEKENNTDK